MLVNDTPICPECLNELKKHQVSNDKVLNRKLMENTIRNLTLDGLRKISRWS